MSDRPSIGGPLYDCSLVRGAPIGGGSVERDPTLDRELREAEAEWAAQLAHDAELAEPALDTVAALRIDLERAREQDEMLLRREEIAFPLLVWQRDTLRLHASADPQGAPLSGSEAASLREVLAPLPLDGISPIVGQFVAPMPLRGPGFTRVHTCTVDAPAGRRTVGLLALDFRPADLIPLPTLRRLLTLAEDSARVFGPGPWVDPREGTAWRLHAAARRGEVVSVEQVEVAFEMARRDRR